MPLPPIVFAPPRRDPSLVQQAIVGTLTGLVRKKLIDEPLLKRQEKFYTGERLEREKFTVSEREAGEEARTELARYTGVDVPIEAEEAQEDYELGLSIIPGMVPIAEAEQRAIRGYDPKFDPAPLATTRRGQRLRREARGDLLGSLSEQARTRAVVDQTKQARADWMAGILDRFGVHPSQLPVFMVKDAETGETRMPNDEEMSLRAVTHGIQAGEMAEFEGDERFVGLKREADELESRVVPVPAYSAEAELEMLGEITQATPGAESARNLRGVATWLRSVGLVGGGGPGEDFWFTNDAGEEVRVDTEAEFFVEFPAQSQSRIRGALWARVFFQNPDTFGAAKQAYGLRDAVAEDTYRKITGSVGPPVSFSSVTSGQLQESLAELESRVPAPKAMSRAERAQAFVSLGAQAMIESDSTRVEDLELYTNLFAADPTAYGNAIAEMETLFALPDDEFQAALIEGNPSLRKMPARGTMGGSSAEGSNEPFPERDAFRLSVYQLFEVARIEAQERRRAAQQ